MFSAMLIWVDMSQLKCVLLLQKMVTTWPKVSDWKSISQGNQLNINMKKIKPIKNIACIPWPALPGNILLCSCFIDILPYVYCLFVTELLGSLKKEMRISVGDCKLNEG